MTFLSHFTPSLMTPETLEAIFVQREELAQSLVELIRESVLTESKHHALLIGPRGIGKTHLVALLYHRISAMSDLRGRLLVAWLREEEWGVMSFLDLLLRVIRALRAEKYNTTIDKITLAERIESLYDLPPNTAERVAGTMLKEVVGNQTLLLIIENVDDLFDGLGDKGQKRLHAYLRENPFCTILATAQRLFKSVSSRRSPFHGFFRIHHLEGLEIEDAVRLLMKIANLKGDRELASFIQTPTGHARICAVHHLTGGNHRTYVILSQFLTRESLDDLVESFLHIVDDLTPYYRARIEDLSYQQRKIVEFLCDQRQAVSVKEIARRCFITHRTASGQLRILREIGYVHQAAISDPLPDKRESFYEIREPLMRLCVETKKQRGEQVRLIVEFLRLWFTRTELQHHLELIRPDAVLQRECILGALQATEGEMKDQRVAAYVKDFNTYSEKGDFVQALYAAEELVIIRGHAEDWFVQGYCFVELRRYDEALISFDEAVKLKPREVLPWGAKGWAQVQLGRLEEALASFNKVIELDPNNLGALKYQSWILDQLGRLDEELAALRKVIELDPKDSSAWGNRGVILCGLGRLDEALEHFDKVIELEPNDVKAWKNRGVVLDTLERLDEALECFNKVIELEPNNKAAWHTRSWILTRLGYEDEEELASWDKVIDLDPENVSAWGNRGVTLFGLGRKDEALKCFDRVIEIEPNDVPTVLTWGNRGMVLASLDRWDEGFASYDKAMDLCKQFSSVFLNSAEFLVYNTGSILSHLFLSTHDIATWRTRARALIELHEKHRFISTLGAGLVRSIPSLNSEMVSNATARAWENVWQELAGDRAEFQIPLRLLGAAVRYRETHDPRILLKLPVEERSLLEPLLKGEKIKVDKPITVPDIAARR